MRAAEATTPPPGNRRRSLALSVGKAGGGEGAPPGAQTFSRTSGGPMLFLQPTPGREHAWPRIASRKKHGAHDAANAPRVFAGASTTAQELCTRPLPRKIRRSGSHLHELPAEVVAPPVVAPLPVHERPREGHGPDAGRGARSHRPGGPPHLNTHEVGTRRIEQNVDIMAGKAWPGRGRRSVAGTTRREYQHQRHCNTAAKLEHIPSPTGTPDARAPGLPRSCLPVRGPHTHPAPAVRKKGPRRGGPGLAGVRRDDHADYSSYTGHAVSCRQPTRPWCAGSARGGPSLPTRQAGPAACG